MTTTISKVNGVVSVQSRVYTNIKQTVFRTRVHCGAAMTRLLQLDCSLLIAPATLNKRSTEADVAGALRYLLARHTFRIG